MAPPYRKIPPDPDAPARVGGRIAWRKSGAKGHVGLIRWIYPDGSMRVKPDLGRETIITPKDIERACK